MSDNDQKEYDVTNAPFSWDKLDGLLAYKASGPMCAELLGCHVNTIKNHIKERYNMTFAEYAERKLSATKAKLVQKALQMAYNGNCTMMIFCLKNLCGWADKQEQELTQTEKTIVTVNRAN